jgi:hypothetical protein
MGSAGAELRKRRKDARGRFVMLGDADMRKRGARDDADDVVMAIARELKEWAWFEAGRPA